MFVANLAKPGSLFQNSEAMYKVIAASICVMVGLMFADERAEASGQVITASGLEVEAAKRIPVVIEDISSHGGIGLTRERVEARVNQVLRKNGITPVDAQADPATDFYLYVNVALVGPAFSISVEFHRRVEYRVANRELAKFGASTWNRGLTGTTGGRVTSILDGVENLTELFVNAFLKANGD